MSEPINVRVLAPGTRVVLATAPKPRSSTIRRDGVWVFARYLSSPRDPALVGQEEMIFAQDVVAVAEA